MRNNWDFLNLGDIDTNIPRISHAYVGRNFKSLGPSKPPIGAIQADVTRDIVRANAQLEIESQKIPLHYKK